MQSKDFTVTGNIIDRVTKQGVAGIHIEVCDLDLFFDDFRSSYAADVDRSLEIQFDKTRFKELIERRPDFFADSSTRASRLQAGNSCSP